MSRSNRKYFQRRTHFGINLALSSEQQAFRPAARKTRVTETPFRCSLSCLLEVSDARALYQCGPAAVVSSVVLPAVLRRAYDLVLTSHRARPEPSVAFDRTVRPSLAVGRTF